MEVYIFFRLQGSVAHCETPSLASMANIANVPCKGALRLAFSEQGAQPSQVFYVVYILCLHGSVTACLLGLWVYIPHETCMPVSSGCCVLSGRGLCDGLITCPGLSYRAWCVWVWLRSLDSEDALAHWGCCAIKKDAQIDSCSKRFHFLRSNLTLRRLMSYIYIWSTHSWCF